MIMLILLLFLFSSVAVRFEYGDGIRLKISYLCFTVFSIPAKKKKKKKAKKTSDKKKVKDKSEEKDEDKKDKKKLKLTLEEIIDLIKMVIESVGKPTKKLIKRTRIYHFALDMTCGGEDAAKAAMNFGRTNILVGNLLGLVDTFFTLKPIDDLHIDVDFMSEDTTMELSFTVKLTVFASLAFVFTLLGRAIRFYCSHQTIKDVVSRVMAKDEDNKTSKKAA